MAAGNMVGKKNLGHLDSVGYHVSHWLTKWKKMLYNAVIYIDTFSSCLVCSVGKTLVSHQYNPGLVLALEHEMVCRHQVRQTGFFFFLGNLGFFPQ